MIIQQQDFYDFLVASNMRKNSIEAYNRDVKALIKWLSDQNVSAIHQLRADHISDYLDHLEKSGKSSATISRQVTVVRSFCRFLTEKGTTVNIVALNRKRPVVEKKAVLILTKAEVQKMLLQPNSKTSMGLRDYLMLRMMYETGIKVSEIISLTISNVDLKRKRVTCHTDYAQRVVYLNQELCKIIKKYLTLREATDKSRQEGENYIELEQSLFSNCFGRPLSRQALWKIVKSSALSAGLSSEVTPHTLRHSFAVHLLQDGGTIRHLQIMMGHQDVTSTQTYENYLDQSQFEQENDQAIN